MSIGRNRTILKHGDVQTSSSWLRKKKEYLVLTETHLIRYKNSSKAVENFPALSTATRSPFTRHASSPSVESAIMETLSLASDSSEDLAHAIPLVQVVAVFLPDDSRHPNSLEVGSLDNESGQGSFLTLTLPDANERDSWLQAIRKIANSVRLEDPEPFVQKHVNW